MSSPAQRVALVTGCSEGSIGEGLARRLAKLDYKVYATVRSTGKGAYLRKIKGISVLIVDVSSPSSIAEFAAELRRRLKPYHGKLDLLINNAGIGVTGPLIEVDLEQTKKLYDTNIWGLLAITQVCAQPIISAQGTIVNVSSVAGAMNVPWNGLTASSKAAVTVLSETMRVELEPLGVRVVTGVLGKVDSRFYKNDGWHSLTEGSYYQDIESHILNTASGSLGQKGEPVDKFVQDFVQDIESGAKGYIYRGAMAQILRFAAFLPSQTIDSYLRPLTGLDDLIKSQKQKVD